MVSLLCSDPQQRLRREIANNNERKRAQAINNGFDALRRLLPQANRQLSKVGSCCYTLSTTVATS